MINVNALSDSQRAGGVCAWALWDRTLSDLIVASLDLQLCETPAPVLHSESLLLIKEGIRFFKIKHLC